MPKTTARIITRGRVATAEVGDQRDDRAGTRTDQPSGGGRGDRAGERSRTCVSAHGTRSGCPIVQSPTTTGYPDSVASARRRRRRVRPARASFGKRGGWWRCCCSCSGQRSPSPSSCTTDPAGHGTCWSRRRHSRRWSSRPPRSSVRPSRGWATATRGAPTSWSRGSASWRSCSSVPSWCSKLRVIAQPGDQTLLPSLEVAYALVLALGSLSLYAALRVSPRSRHGRGHAPRAGCSMRPVSRSS